MIATFVAPMSDRPVGGIAMIHELAHALHRRGHEVQIVHADVLGKWGKRGEGELFCPPSPPGVRHFHVDELVPANMPKADVRFWTTDELDADESIGLPAALVQGYRMFAEKQEHAVYRRPCPKLCVASWLVDVGVELGVPREELVHLPLGLHHEVFRLTAPIEGRRPRVSFCHNVHPRKRAELGYAVLERVHRELPDVEVVVFGATRPRHRRIPPWIRFVHRPSPEVLVEDVYNGSSVFLCTSEVEGFGLTNVEAMACGAALVTSDNGGSRDYAVHGETALVAPPGDVDALAEGVVALLTDEEARVRIAEAGRRHVARFTWEATGERLEAFLERYLADPVAYGRPR